MNQDQTASESQFKINLSFAGRNCEAEVGVPCRDILLLELLPLIWKLQDALIAIWAETAQEEGFAISCQKGCGACCRQLVPLSAIEAAHLRDVVARMPAESQTKIRDRFNAAITRLEKDGMRRRLEELVQLQGFEEKRQLGMDYFNQGIPCPFLEAESCCIHSERPSSCREYLVTSPAIHCAHPTPEGVQTLGHRIKFSQILYRFADGAGNSPPTLLPLILAMGPNMSRPPSLQQRHHAPQLFGNFLKQLSILLGSKSDSPHNSATEESPPINPSGGPL